jgi:hypothetical protein
LTKSYELICERDTRGQRPFLLSQTSTLYKCLGCKIDWKEGKDLSVSFHPVNGKEISQDTFFTFFATPNDDGIKPSIRKILKRLENVSTSEKEDDEEEKEEEDQDLDVIFSMDQEIGQFLKDVFIPKSILYYIGALNENIGDLDDGDFQEYNEMCRAFDEDENDEEEDDSDDNDDIDEDEAEEDFKENEINASKIKKRKI